MIKKSLLILFLSFSFQQLFCQENLELSYKVKDLDEAYTINFPEKVTRELTDLNTQDGVVKMYSYSFSTEDGSVTLFSSSLTYIDGTLGDDISKEQAHEILDSSIDGALGNIDGTLIDSDYFIFNGYYAKKATISLDDDLIVSLKIYLVGDKMYLLQYLGVKGLDIDEAFFDTFELINVKK